METFPRTSDAFCFSQVVRGVGLACIAGHGERAGFLRNKRILRQFTLVLTIVVGSGVASKAQMVTGAEMPGFAAAFGLEHPATDYSVQETGVRVGQHTMINLVLPGETAELTLHFTNESDAPVQAQGNIEVIEYRTRVPVGEIWVPHVFKTAVVARQPIAVSLPAHGSQDVTLQPRIGDELGGYALIVDVPGHGRAFAAAFIRSLQPDEGRLQFPTYALDATHVGTMNEGMFALFQRLGVKGMRLEYGFGDEQTAAYQAQEKRYHQYLDWAKKYDIAVLLTIENSSPENQPLGEPRPWLSSDGRMLKTKDDRAWLPSYDGEFQEWIHRLAKDYGWPRGNVNAMELWNEPWEGVSISGWGADTPRYQEMFTRMAQGIEEARAQDGSQVLVGGLCSSANARDKLFADGSDRFLKWLDFVSIHYQPLGADPSLDPEWIHRKSEYGPVRVWDTESWIANSEDRIAGVVASMRAQGQSRTNGIFDGNVYDSVDVEVNGHVYPVVQMWAPGAAVAAMQKFLGQRDFDHLLFQNGLPWVFMFKGTENAPDDGTAVVLGDMKKIYDPGRTLFRSIHLTEDASLRLTDPDSVLRLFDFYGNPIAESGHTARIPLNGYGYFVRSDGSPGSFEKVINILRAGRIEGVDPVEIIVRDLTGPIADHPALSVTLTNVLNRPVEGRLTASVGSLNLEGLNKTIQLAPNETKAITLRVTAGAAVASNSYPARIHFDAGKDGKSTHEENLHVNLIAHRTIHVDGDLSDWKGVLPQILPAEGIAASLTEKAYLPEKDFGKQTVEGSSTVYLAYDEKYFYFAAQIAESTPEAGVLRFENRNDDDYFYPDTVKDLYGKEKAWPQGVPHFSYRKGYDLPSGADPHDNVEIAFNVIDNKPWLDEPPGTLPRFITYWDTDYEFALNKVAPAYGGGFEIWRLKAPGIPLKHFFPREPKSPIDGGPVHDGQLTVDYRGGVRYVEAAIPWHEIPEVRERIVAGKTIKFSCRINRTNGEARELATERSVSKINTFTFHNYWETHWSNEVEFGAEALGVKSLNLVQTH
jgi:hypothetical protein